MKKIDLELTNGSIEKENAKSILKSTLFDSVRVMEKTYKKRIEEILTFKYSNKLNTKICKEALTEKMQEMLYVLECSKDLPSYGDIIKTPNGEGQVINVDILNRKVKVLINGNKEEVVIKKNGKISKK